MPEGGRKTLGANEKYTGLKHFIKAFGWSVQGFRTTFSGESAFRHEILIALFLVPLGVYLGNNGIERALLVGSVLIVLVVELLNTSIESVVDRVGLEHHHLAGRAKDVGSAAVFMSCAIVIVVWALILTG